MIKKSDSIRPTVQRFSVNIVHLFVFSVVTLVSGKIPNFHVRQILQRKTTHIKSGLRSLIQ